MLTALLVIIIGVATASDSSDRLAGAIANNAIAALCGPTVAWDETSRVRISSPHMRRTSYPRLTELQDGALLCVFEGEGSVFATRSTDRGRSWNKPVPVAWRQHGISMAAPEVLELHDGSILACYNPRPYIISGTRNFGIRTRKSYDGGRTWIHGRLLYEGRHKFTDGCWEPAPVQMPDGEIRVFFANEATFAGEEHNDQNISMLRSHDGGLTWTTQPEAVSYKEHGRDGMPVPLLLRDGAELVCAIEQTIQGGQLQPALLRLSDAPDCAMPLDGESRYREAPLDGLIPPMIYAGAPYLRQLSTGETLLSYQGTEGRHNRLHDADMKVWVGDAHARNFSGCTTPFDVPPGRGALWSSLAVLHDDTIIAITSTTAYGNKWEIWMIKGRLAQWPCQELLEDLSGD